MPVGFNVDVLFTFLSSPPAAGPAFAYIDPGAGSILLQAFLAGLAGCAVLMSMFWGNVKRFFASFTRRGKEEPALPEAPKGDSTE